AAETRSAADEYVCSALGRGPEAEEREVVAAAGEAGDPLPIGLYVNKFYEVFIRKESALDGSQLARSDSARQLTRQVLGQAIARSDTAAADRRVVEGITHVGPAAVHRNGQLVGTQVGTPEVMRFLVGGLPQDVGDLAFDFGTFPDAHGSSA